MYDNRPTLRHLAMTAILAILIIETVYSIGSNLLNWLFPGTVTGSFLFKFFE